MPSINTKHKRGEAKYSKLLNNLLDIKGKDQTIFTKVNGTSSFDVTTKFGARYSDKILSQNNFTLKLKEVDLEDLLSKLRLTSEGLVVIEMYEKYKEKLFNTTKILLENPKEFIKTKKELIEKLEVKIQKINTRWKQFRRKVIDINIQDNIWPLHISTAFVSIRTNKKLIYAPLLLKEVRIQINESKIIIKSEDTWKINEKLVFLLNEAGHEIDDNVNQKEMTTIDFIEYISKQLNTQITKDDLIGEFKNLKREDIKNKKLLIHPGVILGIFKPAGGHLRKTMLNIIDNDEIDEIIDIEPDKSIYKNNLLNFITHNSNELLKIQPSNYSQDKALSSSLIQNTIIWGPPGTGKSQVIANIIANILYRNKTAIIMSQKKAALDVLKKRLGKISAFTLFILNDNKMIKKEFYKPLQEFIKMVENRNEIDELKKENIITKNELAALQTITNAKKEGKYYPSLKLLEHIGTNTTLLEPLFKINSSFMYPKVLMRPKEYLEVFAKNNNVQKKNFLFFKKYPKSIKVLAISACKLLENELDIESCKTYVQKTNKATVHSLLETSYMLKRENKYQSDGDYLASFLSTSIIEKINNWKVDRRDLHDNYKRFAAAARAGRRLPYKFVDDHIKIIKKLFPVIITTPEISFIDWERNSFDYAILDESSQIFLEIGLPILYLAKNHVLAGDRQQMQPSRWFATRDDSEEEEDVVENADSLLDYAFDKGVFQVMLNKNYRSSAAALMAFSSKKFYESKLEVINKAKKIEKIPIEIVNVKGIWESRMNHIEAQKAVSIAKNNINKYEKIIILTFNSNQRQLIEKIILEKEGNLTSAIENEKLAIRNIENIQGDEADLVIVSVVYDHNTYIGSTYVAKSGGKNALNVAISRAKDKMIVIKSITSKSIKLAKSEDFKVFREWLEFLDMSSKKQQSYSMDDANNSIEESYGDAESSFEVEVIKAIKDNVVTKDKLKLIKQYSVGSKRIDIALINSKGKYILGIEVDGYRYHGGQGFDKYLEDYSRQEFLENKGYNIFRIKEIDWKIDRNKVLSKIKLLLNKSRK